MKIYKITEASEYLGREGMTDLDYLTLYKNETGCSPFTWVDGYEKLTWQYYEWKIKYITVDRDKLQAEVEKWRANYETMLDGYEDVNNELQSMTARCKAAEEERDSYMFLLKGLLERGDCKICEDGRAEIDDLFKAWLTLKNKEVYFFEPLEKEISVEDMQKIVDANERLVKELKYGNK